MPEPQIWLVTGGCGFIGSNFIRRVLRERGDVRIVNLDALTYAGNPANLAAIEDDPRYAFVQGSIGDGALVGELLGSQGVSAVVHFAAESHVDRSIDSARSFVETNVLGTFELLESARHYWRQLDEGRRSGFRFLHVSTDEVFGSLGSEEPAFCETTSYKPNSPYSATKAASDHLVRSYFHTYGMPVVTTNCSNNYGPYQFPEKLLPLMILKALGEEPLPVYGDGKNIRDWLYVEDHASAIELALERGRLGEVYCIGGRAEMENIRIVETLCDLLDERRPRPGGGSYRELIRFVADRPGHDRRYAIDCRKIEEELGWCPRETFETGLRKTVDWYLDHLDWCRDIQTKRYQQERLGLS
ncbi:MAG: dTDP-glucose 4,6-dehydratase [Verrucomicrobiota bacterium]